MNSEEDFEHKLRALTAKLARPDPTPVWKGDILSRASQAREMKTPRSPRWILSTLGAAWLLIAVLHFTTPSDGSRLEARGDASNLAATEHAPLHMLMAFRARAELLDLP